jgi:hypothetical protein
MDYAAISSLISSLALFAWPAVALFIARAYKKEVSILFRVFLRKRISLELPGEIKINAGGEDQQKAEASSVPDKLRRLSPDLPRTPAIEKLEKELLGNVANLEEKKRTEILAFSLAEARLHAAFGVIYAQVYGSQILGLFELDVRRRVTNEEAHAFFIEYAAKRFPPIYENYSYSGWLRFLIANNLIEQDQNYVSITEIGREFVAWLRRTRLPLEKQG